MCDFSISDWLRITPTLSSHGTFTLLLCVNRPLFCMSAHIATVLPPYMYVSFCPSSPIPVNSQHQELPSVRPRMVHSFGETSENCLKILLKIQFFFRYWFHCRKRYYFFISRLFALSLNFVVVYFSQSSAFFRKFPQTGHTLLTGTTARRCFSTGFMVAHEHDANFQYNTNLR